MNRILIRPTEPRLFKIAQFASDLEIGTYDGGCDLGQALNW
jgi:hypothetical protein